ncbi:MAG TPA: substrate-binding domain-containing protein [Xanthobacteraceae bacterium]|nr:substrate-binding domain-containing protein [Xanthobacteraceae bacterium]
MAASIDLKVLSTTAMKMVFEELSPRFERETGDRLSVSLGPSTQLEKRLAEGEAADVAIITTAGARELIARGKIVTGSEVLVARSSIGIAVPKGTPKPDISSVEGFKRALLAAKSIAVSKPVGGGQSGAHMAKVFDDLGIAEAMRAKAKYGAGGAAGLAGLIVLRGEAEIGIQQMAELIAVSGIDVVGPLPKDLQSVTPFTAAILVSASHPEAGRALIAFLTTPAAKSVIKARGLEPV